MISTIVEEIRQHCSDVFIVPIRTTHPISSYGKLSKAAQGHDAGRAPRIRQIAFVDNFDRGRPVLSCAVRYLVKAKVRPGKLARLLASIGNGTLGQSSVAGDEYIYNMHEARLNPDGVATWVETCFCDPPLAEERPHWEEYFDLLSVKDAHARRNCRHENGAEPWACCNCDCTKNLEEKLRSQGESFLERLREDGSS